MRGEMLREFCVEQHVRKNRTGSIFRSLYTYVMMLLNTMLCNLLLKMFNSGDNSKCNMLHSMLQKQCYST